MSGMTVKKPGVCTWTAKCADKATHRVRSHTRPGLVLSFDVCPFHRASAVRQGYRDVGPLDGVRRCGRAGPVSR